MTKAIARKRIADLEALTEIRATALIWHGIVCVTSGDQQEYATKLHSAVASIRGVMAYRDLRKELIALVEQAQKQTEADKR